jgi:anti-sigma B factor antagonist
LAKSSLVVQTRSVQKSLIVDVRGEVDLFSSPKMRTVIMDAIGHKGVTRVAVNMSGVSYIDSSGIATFVEGLRSAREKNCGFVLFSLQQGARDVLELARLDTIFDIRADEAAALSE